MNFNVAATGAAVRSSSTRLSRILALSALCAATIVPLAGFAQATGTTPAVGATAPDFTLATPTGTPVALASDLSQGETVLVILRGYPGYQCPFCAKQVHDFVEHAPQFAEKHVNVLLVYPGPPADLDQHAKEFLTKQANLPANVQLVIDPDYKVTNLYGLRWDAPHETAYPSTFILKQDGKVSFEKVSHEHGDRTSAEDVLKQL